MLRTLGVNRSERLPGANKRALVGVLSILPFLSCCFLFSPFFRLRSSKETLLLEKNVLSSTFRSSSDRHFRNARRLSTAGCRMRTCFRYVPLGSMISRSRPNERDGRRQLASFRSCRLPNFIFVRPIESAEFNSVGQTEGFDLVRKPNGFFRWLWSILLVCFASKVVGHK